MVQWGVLDSDEGGRASAWAETARPDAWRGTRRGAVTALLTGALLASTQAIASAAEIKRIEADPAARSAAIDAGRRVAGFCFNCHGEDGHSKQPDTPNMAGQNAVYLFEQIRKFAAGERKNEFMQGLTRALPDDDRINVALYFSAQKPLPAATKPGPRAPAGEAIFRRVCVSCHGEQANGNEEIPRIAGQQPAYLARALAAYRGGSGERRDPRMSAVAATLSDDDIGVLTAYLSALR